MTTTAQAVDFTPYTPVRVPLGVLQVLTEAQIEKIGVLIGGWHPARVELATDSWAKENILFSLIDDRDHVLLNGLIEPDGRSHT